MADIISIALSLLGVIFIVLLVTGGYGWMMAGGNEEDMKKAKDRIRTAIIGLLIVLIAYSLTWFIFTRLPFAGGGGTPGVPI